MQTDLLQMRDIDKAFNGIPVLRNAGFTLRKGECHALMGENGAGKSTLMKILTGVYRRDGGIVELDGQDVTFHAPRDAEAAGIAMIFQEFSLIPTLTVAQNIFLGHEPRTAGKAVIRDGEMVRRARAILEEFGESIDPRARVEDDRGKIREWRSKVLPRYKRLTKKAEALIASVYLAGTNTRRVKRALFGLFQGAVSKDVVSRAWRKVKVDWDAWRARDLADEEIVRLILDGTVIKTRLDRKATNISVLAAIGAAGKVGSQTCRHRCSSWLHKRFDAPRAQCLCPRRQRPPAASRALASSRVSNARSRRAPRRA